MRVTGCSLLIWVELDVLCWLREAKSNYTEADRTERMPEKNCQNRFSVDGDEKGKSGVRTRLADKQLKD
jgi:hypothetical protein